MNLRGLIREAVRSTIPFEHQVEIKRDTAHEGRFFAGGKPFNAKEMGLADKRPVIRPVENKPFPKVRVRTEREKDFDKFMQHPKNGVGGSFEPSATLPAPRLDVLMCGSILKEVKVNRIFEDLNGNHVVHADVSSEKDPSGISAWTEKNGTRTQAKVMEALDKVNKTFGTAYFIDVSYPKEREEIFVIKSGRIDKNSGKPVTYGQFLDFDEIIREHNMILHGMEAVRGLKSITADNTPWREITEPLKTEPYRMAIVAKSHRNV